MPSISRHLFEQLNVRKEKTGYYRLNESNAVVDCKTDHKIIAHSEDEKPVDCKIEKKPLEKPLTEGVSPDNPFLKAALDAYKNDDKAIGVVVSVKVKGNDEQIEVNKLYHSDDEFENIKKELNDKYGDDIIDISAIHDRAKIKAYEDALNEECDEHEECEDCNNQEVEEVEEVKERVENENLKEYLGDDNDPKNQVDEEEEYYERKEDELQDKADRLLDKERDLAWDELDWPDVND